MLNPMPKKELKGKRVLLRVDLNSNVQKGAVQQGKRFEEHAKTISFLSKSGARTIVLSHQGRKGQSDFVSLQQHSKILSKILKKKVKFVSWKEDYLKAISSLKNSEILLLENTRFLDFESREAEAEEHSLNPVISSIASSADFFVLDALSVSHRAHATVVGFIPLLPSFAGPVLENELNELNKVLSFTKTPRIAILGGAKPEDSIEIASFLLDSEKIELLLVGGVLGELFVKAEGHSLGRKDKQLQEKGFLKHLSPIKEILSKHRKKILLPIDLAFDAFGERKELLVEQFPSKYSSKDIGARTIELFCGEIRKAKLIIFNGPLGVFEEASFGIGTKKVLEAVSSSKAFSFIGGGDTEAAIEKLKINKKKFSYISLSGKASMDYLADKNLPALDALSRLSPPLREAFILKKKDLSKFLSLLQKDFSVIVPVRDYNASKHFREFSQEDELYLFKRTWFSPKKFFLPAHEELFEFRDEKHAFTINHLIEKKAKVFFGLRSCDLHALLALDKVFSSDAFYLHKRSHSAIIGLSCINAGESCFCTSLGTHIPKGFDLFFWETQNDFFVEVGSEKGKELIQKAKSLFSKPSFPKPAIIPSCELELEKNFEPALINGYFDEVWEKKALDCLSCGACTMVCPTCYCFRVKDDVFLGSNDSIRMREWDSCQLMRFSRISGDRVVRAKRSTRLKQFVSHKLYYFKKIFGSHLCVGCGRCIEECPTSISIVDIANAIALNQKKAEEKNK